MADGRLQGIWVPRWVVTAHQNRDRWQGRSRLRPSLFGFFLPRFPQTLLCLVCWRGRTRGPGTLTAKRSHVFTLQAWWLRL